MTGNEFHKIINEQLQPLVKYGFCKTKSKRLAWIIQIEKDISFELMVRQDKYGWTPEYGGSFVYDVLPCYCGKPVMNYPAKQIRMYEFSRIESTFLDSTEDILRQYSMKLPRFDGCDMDDEYVYLKSTWTKNKIMSNIGDWYYFYDREDLCSWIRLTLPLMLRAINDIKDEILDGVHKYAADDAILDSSTGEMLITSRSKK